jgi:hypothetical protein
MNKKTILGSLLVLSLAASPANADIIWQATIKEMIVPTGGTETAVVSFNILVAPSGSPFSTNCEGSFGRVKFSKSDKQTLAFLMFAHALNKKVAFYYEPNGTTLGGIPGHGTGTCELINVWTLPD